jgi:hypothetical protein
MMPSKSTARAAAPALRVARARLQAAVAALGELPDPVVREHAARAFIEDLRTLGMPALAQLRAGAVRQLHAGGLTWRQVGPALDPPLQLSQVYRLRLDPPARPRAPRRRGPVG